MLAIMILGTIATFKTNPDSAAAFSIFTLIMLFAIFEHILNPRNEITGEYKIM
jgi:hypothetical protein